MSTNSTIGITRKDRTVTKIYCHWDGYIEHNGVILQLAYNTPEKIEKLLALGNLSSLGYYTNPDPTKEHSVDGERQPNVCAAYHRDRGEEFKNADNYGPQEFNYMFDEYDGIWYVEVETAVSNTKTQKLLGTETFFKYDKFPLLDKISEYDFSWWETDEFAEAGKVYEACLEKAREAINEKKHKEAMARVDSMDAVDQWRYFMGNN